MKTGKTRAESPTSSRVKISGLFSLLFIFSIVFFSVPRTLAQEENIILKHSAGGERIRKPNVVFPHLLHMEELDCADCHHKFEDGQNIIDEDELYEGNDEVMCLSCHKVKKNCDIQKLFHASCMGCHIESKKMGERSGPRLCSGCHSSDVKKSH